MPITAKLPDGRTITVPDDTTPEELDALVNDDASKDTSIHGQMGAALRQPTKEGRVDAMMAALENDPLIQGAAQGGLAPAGLGKLPEKVMDLAFGAQAGVKTKFPGVNYSAAALREGVGATNVGKADRLGKEAARGVRASVRAADLSGAKPIQPSEVSAPLRKILGEAGLAKRPDLEAATADRIKTMYDQMRGGVSMEGAQLRKGILQREGKAALNAGNPKDAAFTPQLANAEREGLLGVMRGRSGDVGAALDRSQEMMALQRATRAANNRQATSRLLLGGAAGAVTGGVTGDPIAGLAAAAAPALMLSPRGLSGTAHVLHRGSPSIDALVRALIMGMTGQE